MNPHPSRLFLLLRWRWSARGAALRVLGGLALFASGCQTYERQPLDLVSHRAAFLARTPQHPEVQHFAEALGRQGHHPDSDFDLTDGVSGEEAEVIALVFNADLRLARLRAGVTQATADHAGLWADPSLGIDLTRILQSTPEPWKFATTVGLTLPVSGRLQIEKERAGIEHAAELARVVQLEWETRIALRRAWTQWSALQAQLVTTRQFFERIDQVLALVDPMEAAGEMTRAEARLFRLERATKMAELARLEAQAHEARLHLKQQMGLPPDAAALFQPSGLGASASEEMPVTPETLETRHPAMVVAAAEYQAAEKALELEIRRQYPDLQIGPGYGREDGQDQVLLGLSLPIPVLDRNRQGIAEARAQREVARASAEVTLEQLLAAARAAQIRFVAARRERLAFEVEIVPLVDALYADARQLAGLGEVNTLVLLESLTRQQEAKTRLIVARCDEALARIDLQALLGPPVAVAPGDGAACESGPGSRLSP